MTISNANLAIESLFFIRNRTSGVRHQLGTHLLPRKPTDRYGEELAGKKKTMKKKRKREREREGKVHVAGRGGLSAVR